MALLEVRDLKTHFRTDDGIVKAVDGVTFSIEKGQTLGIVGESGSGKSVTCLTIMGLNAKRNTMSSGEALFKDDNLLTMSPGRLREAVASLDDFSTPAAHEAAQQAASPVSSRQTERLGYGRRRL